jgi:hypothetical protein
MMQIQPAPFFASKNRYLLNLQLAGWGGAFLLRPQCIRQWVYNQLVLNAAITGF